MLGDDGDEDDVDVNDIVGDGPSKTKTNKNKKNWNKGGGSSSQFCNNPCITKYVKSVKEMGIQYHDGQMSYDEWEQVLCHTTSKIFTSKPKKLTSNSINNEKVLIIGIGPRTTTSRSVSLVIYMFQLSVSHFKVCHHHLF